MLHCKLNVLLPVLLPRAQLVSQQISVLQVEKNCCSNLYNILLQLATLKFVAIQVEHAVVILATTRSNCNATMSWDKLNNLPSLYTIGEYLDGLHEHLFLSFPPVIPQHSLRLISPPYFTKFIENKCESLDNIQSYFSL